MRGWHIPFRLKHVLETLMLNWIWVLWAPNGRTIKRERIWKKQKSVRKKTWYPESIFTVDLRNQLSNHSTYSGTLKQGTLVSQFDISLKYFFLWHLTYYVPLIYEWSKIGCNDQAQHLISETRLKLNELLIMYNTYIYLIFLSREFCII